MDDPDDVNCHMSKPGAMNDAAGAEMDLTGQDGNLEMPVTRQLAEQADDPDILLLMDVAAPLVAQVVLHGGLFGHRFTRRSTAWRLAKTIGTLDIRSTCRQPSNRSSQPGSSAQLSH